MCDEKSGSPCFAKVLVVLEHAVKPWEKLLRAVIRVNQHRDAIARRDQTHVMSSGNSSQNGLRKGRWIVLQTFACIES